MPIPNKSNHEPKIFRTTYTIAARNCSTDCPNVTSTNEARSIISNITYRLNKSEVKNEPITPTVNKRINVGR